MHESATAAGVREVAPGVCVLDISGDVTAASEQVLVSAYTVASERGATVDRAELHRPAST